MFENKKILYIGAGVFVVLIIIIIIFATTCGKKKTTTTQTGPITLNVWSLYDDVSAYKDIITDFTKKNPNVKVNFVKKDLNDYLAQSLDEMASEKGPDVWIIPNDWMPKYHDKLVAMKDAGLANKKKKMNAIEVYKSTFLPVVAQDNIIDNQIYGIPAGINTLHLFINTRLMQKTLDDYRQAHPKENVYNLQAIANNGPKNWDDFTQLVRSFTKKTGNNINQSVVAMGTPDTVAESTDILTMIMLQNGTKMTSDDLSTAQFHTKQNSFSGGSDFPGTKSLDFYTSFANSSSENYTWNDSIGDSVRAFAEEKIIMMIDYPSKKNDLKRINPNLSYTIFAVPQVKETQNAVNFTSYLTMTVTKASKNPDLAWNFILLTTNSNLTGTYANATGTKSAKIPSYDDGFNFEVKQSKTAQSWYKPEPDKSDTIFKDMIRQVNEGKNSQTAIENAASQITTLLQELKQ